MKKSILKLSWLLIIALVSFTACKDDDDNGGDNPTPVEDGIYVIGEGTALTATDAKGMMKVTRNEVTQEDRSQLLEIYIAVKAAGTFNIVEVSGSVTKTYGPDSDFAIVSEADRDGDEPKVDFWRGGVLETDAKFTVSDAGLYHIVMDKELMKVAVAPVKWGVIGGATPGGWGENTEMPSASFDLNTMTFEVAEVTLLENEWKFRYSDGWKIILDADYDLGDGKKGVKVNTNYGGAVDALVPGGANITNAKYGVYKITMTWTLGSGNSAAIEWVKDAEVLPEYPEAMYLVGAGTAYGWDAPGTKDSAIMHKLAGGGDNEGIFWKICHIEAGQGFKLSAANWVDPNLGFENIGEFDADGVTVTDNGGNLDIAESGMYMIVVDLRDGANTKLSVIAPKVYGIGDAFGSWDEDVAANLFTVDNTAKTITSPATTADGNIRMYVSHSWIAAWWNAEFNVFDGYIMYRNDGGDQDAVATTTGNVATLSFDWNTGTIE